MVIKKSFVLLVVFVLLLTVPKVEAIDPLEELYNFEILKPRHAPKQKVDLGTTKRIEETFDRGFTAVVKEDKVYLSWRLLKNDTPDTGFLLDRKEEDHVERITESPVYATTDFTDPNVAVGKRYTYELRCHVNGIVSEVIASLEIEPGKTLSYLSVKLRENVVPNRVAVGDLNGDGKFDFIVLHPRCGIDPGGQANLEGLTYKIDAYLQDGTFLWRYDLGPGIEPGVWYSPFIVYDLDGDGKAEILLKTASNVQRVKEGPLAGRVLDGPEHLSVLDGATGKEIAKADWPRRTPRLGDYNRNNRNQLTVARLDGKTPCVIALRGTYKAMFAEAWHYRDGKLVNVWQWDGDEENPVVRAQGAHQTQVADVDGDGRDEIILGSAVLDDDGTLLWSAGVGHSDSAILTVIAPELSGMQILYGNEVKHEKRGVCLVDARTGRQIWNINRKTYHIGGAMAADIDPEKPGLECFAAEDSKGGSRERYLLDAQGRFYAQGDDVPGTKHWVWWDGDKLRGSLQVRGSRNKEETSRIQIKKYKKTIIDELPGRPLMIADLYGDWREEIVVEVPGELRIYSTDIPAADRRVTLLDDSKYRIDVVNQSQGYFQSPTPAFYLGE